MSGRENDLVTFQVITGASKEKANEYLRNANWNTEIAIATWYERGETVDEINPLSYTDLETLNSIPPDPEPTPDEEYIGTIPGLYNKHNDDSIPLKSIDVRAKLINYISDVELTQTYINTSPSPIEAIFKFEHFNATLTNFEVIIDGKNYKGICKEKNEALDDYDDALATGQGAFMVEKDKKDGIFRVSIGNLPPQVECKLILRYVMELESEDQYLKFILPITRTRLQTNSNEGGISIALDIQMPREIKQLKSASHRIDDHYRIDGNRATLSLKSRRFQKYEEGKEFELFIQIQNPNDPVNYVEIFSKLKDMEKVQEEFFKQSEPSSPDLDAFGPQPGQSFFSIPDFPRRSYGFVGFDDPTPPPSEELPKQITDPETPHAAVVSLYPSIKTDDDILSEIIFIVDRSGSMSGSKLNQAKNALQLFLRSLPQNSLFNIVSFGSHFNTLFPKSTKLTEETLSQATHYVAKMEANMAGTNILDPIKSVLNQFKQMKEQDPDTYQQYPKQVFCLTDGEVENTQEVLKFVKNNIDEARIFTFGIGAEASKTLVRGIAKYGRGKEEFVVSGERIEPKVMRQLKRALMPILKNISVDWNGLSHPKYSDLPIHLPPVFDGERLLVYGFLSGLKTFTDQKVTVSGTTGQQVHKWEIPITKQELIEGSLVHRLTSRNYIQNLELHDAKANKDKIVELGIEWGLVTKYTSYVAIEEREAATTSHLQKINVQKEIKQSIYRYSGRSSEGNRFLASADLDGDLYSRQLGVYGSSSLARNEIDHVLLDGNEDRLQSSLFSGGDAYESLKEGGLQEERLLKGSEKKGKKKEKKEKKSYYEEDEEEEQEDPKRMRSQRAGMMDYDSVPTAAKEESSPFSNFFSFFSGSASQPVENAAPSGFAFASPSTSASPFGFAFASPSPSASASGRQSALSPATAPPPLENLHARPLDNFILQQKVDGSFALNDMLLKYGKIAKTAAEISSNVPKELQGLESEMRRLGVWVTAIALLVFEKEFGELKEEWELICEKSNKFVNAAIKEIQQKEPGYTLQTLMQQARDFCSW